jgi:hypothetical protein
LAELSAVEFLLIECRLRLTRLKRGICEDAQYFSLKVRLLMSDML